MSELEVLQARTFIARNRIAELEERLTATEHALIELHERLTLSDQERVLLSGPPDGFIRIEEIQPLLRRVFDFAA